MQALIVGGGIAGPVTAMALQRAGIEATVVEARPAVEAETGSYFTVTANGLEALKLIDARGLAMAAGLPTRRNVMWNHAGRKLASVSLGSTLPGAPAAHTLKRSRLAALLQEEAVRRGIRIEYGRRLVDADVGSDGRALAIFEDGSTRQADLLVGCDGIHSVVRRVIDPAAPDGRYVGLTNFGGITHRAAADIDPGAWHLIFGRRGFFGYQATPTGDVVWFANVPRPMISPVERDSTDVAAWKHQLVGLFEDDNGPAVELVAAGELELAADNTHDLGNVPTWHRGPLIIIGDAAHAPAPSSGQGASMAIEDGVVLARALRDRPTIPAALAEYEQLRRPRVEKVVAFGARSSNNKVPGAFGRLARDLMLPVVLKYMVTEKSLRWLYDYRITWDPSPGRAPGTTERRKARK